MNRIPIGTSGKFHLDEFVPKEIYMQYYEKSLMFINPIAIKMAEGIREYFNVPIIINNWWTGGDYNYSGFRQPDCKVGAYLSQHKMGTSAIDCHFPKGTDYEKVRQTIRDKYDTFRKMGITTFERNVNWLHIDCRQTGMDKLYEVNP